MKRRLLCMLLLTAAVLGICFDAAETQPSDTDKAKAWGRAGEKAD